MSKRINNVLFLCKGNSARSILAEGILRKDGAGRFNAHLAGNQPKGTVHPLALSAFNAALRYMRTRIALFAALPIASLDELSLRARVREIGQVEGASRPRSDVA